MNGLELKVPVFGHGSSSEIAFRIVLVVPTNPYRTPDITLLVKVGTTDFEFRISPSSSPIHHLLLQLAWDMMRVFSRVLEQQKKEKNKVSRVLGANMIGLY